MPGRYKGAAALDWFDRVKGLYGPIAGITLDRMICAQSDFAGGTGTSGDHLVIDLWGGFGVFSGGFRTGTFTISGADSVWEECGLCVRVEADYSGGPNFTDHYMAESGTVELTSINGRLTGSISGVTFRHISVEAGPPERSMVHPDGCETMILSASFDELIL